MIKSNITNYKKFSALHSNFDAAFRYLITENLHLLAEGKYKINSSIYLIKETYQTRAIGETFWEAHEQFIDIQFILKGEEQIAYAPVSSLDEVMYHSEKDLKVLKGKINTIVTLKVNDFAVFFPEDAHMPGLVVHDTPSNVAKIVVKIKV